MRGHSVSWSPRVWNRGSLILHNKNTGDVSNLSKYKHLSFSVNNLQTNRGMRRSNSWPLLIGSDGDEPPVLLKIDSDLDIAGVEEEDDMSTLEITDTDHSVDSRSSVRFNLDQTSKFQDTSFLQRKRASFVTQRHGVYYSLDGEEDDFLPSSVQDQVLKQLGQDMKKRLDRQCSTATTGTQKSYATVTTNLTTIPEEKERSDKGDKARQWMFQGKVQGSVIFRQYYPEGGWGSS